MTTNAYTRFLENPNHADTVLEYLLKNHPNKIDLFVNWNNFSVNPDPRIYNGNIEINWSNLSKNPYDPYTEYYGPYYISSQKRFNYEAMRQRCLIYAEELIANRFHPKNCDKWGDWGFNDMALE